MFVDWSNEWIFFLAFSFISWHTLISSYYIYFFAAWEMIFLYPKHCHHHELWSVRNFSSSKEKPHINDLSFFFKEKNQLVYFFFFSLIFFSVWERFSAVIGMSNSQPFIRRKPENVLWNLTVPFPKGITSCQAPAPTPAIDILQVSDVFSEPLFLTFGSNKSYCL